MRQEIWVRGENPSPVSRFARSTLSHKGRGVAPLGLDVRSSLLPVGEKVPAGRMRGAFAVSPPRIYPAYPRVTAVW